jgi:hypothetical protein
MSLWSDLAKTGQRDANPLGVQVLRRNDGSATARPEQDYIRIWLCEAFLAKDSTLLANWLPAAHVRVAIVRQGYPTVEHSRVIRPTDEHVRGGVALLNYPITDLLPYHGGVIEMDAALIGLQNGTRLDVVLDLLQVVSALPIPGAEAVSVAKQITESARGLVQGTNGAVHIDLHQGWSEGDTGGSPVQDAYVVALLPTEKQVDPGPLCVVDNRLCVAHEGSSPSHLLGWDYLLLRVEVKDSRDDFWLPDLQQHLEDAIDALSNGSPDLAARHRTAAIAAVLKSDALTWPDRDRVIGAVRARFDAVAEAGHGASGRRSPATLTELVEDYGPSLEDVQIAGPLTPELAFAGD